jgi:HemY protein
MTGDRRTYTLGLRGLHVEALRAGDFEAARQHARAAAAADPALPWASSAAFDAATADRDWAAALALLENAQRNGVVDRAIYRRRKAVLLTAMAAEEAQPSPESARRKAAEAHGLAKELVPAAVLAAKLTGSRSRRQANAILEETYRLSPHPDLFAAAFDLAGQSAAERLKRAETLSAIKPRHVDSALGLAAAARAARRFDEAREALRPFAEDRPTQRVCVAMAEIEAADTGDEGRVREWLARAVRAPRDPAWIADGVVAAEWAPVSPVTGRLDAFRWRVPDGVSDHHGPAIDLAALRPSPLAKPADAALPGPGDG